MWHLWSIDVLVAHGNRFVNCIFVGAVINLDAWFVWARRSMEFFAQIVWTVIICRPMRPNGNIAAISVTNALFVVSILPW